MTTNVKKYGSFDGKTFYETAAGVSREIGL